MNSRRFVPPLALAWALSASLFAQEKSVRPGINKPFENPNVKEFLRYVLSQEGQSEVMRDGKYLPLTAGVVREQLKKLGE